mgnify:CR=1 FL=1|jgi:hypothetical protein|tara:strand:+ start:316 stop:573 length:258 start_codon:yes stop_codon:yes gene_type:complete
MNLQYITEESVVDFINGMDEVSTDSILEDPAIIQLLNGSVPQQIEDQPNPLGTIESFLQLFIDREEYEVCAKLVEVHPELLHYDC